MANFDMQLKKRNYAKTGVYPKLTNFLLCAGIRSLQALPGS